MEKWCSQVHCSVMVMTCHVEEGGEGSDEPERRKEGGGSQAYPIRSV